MFQNYPFHKFQLERGQGNRTVGLHVIKILPADLLNNIIKILPITFSKKEILLQFSTPITIQFKVLKLKITLEIK